MRTIGFCLSLIGAVATLGSSGCSDNQLGHLQDPAGPVKLVRVVVQQPTGAQGRITDLIDAPGTPLSTAVACEATLNPCEYQFVLDGNSPDFSCVNGQCNDPLAPGKPVALAPPSVGALQVRLVFNKVLDGDKIETVTVDPTKPPGSDKSYQIMPGIFELDGPDGMPVTMRATSGLFFDPSGSSTSTSDPLVVPYGPAVVMVPAAPLRPSSKYTVKILTTAPLTDRANNPFADQTGAAMSSFAIDFTTEDTALFKQTPAAPSKGMPATLKPDQVLQAALNATVVEDVSPADRSKVDCTGSLMGTTPVNVYAYAERGSDPAMCSANLQTSVLNFVLVDATSQPVDWMAGSYSLSCKISSKDSPSAPAFTYQTTFTVAGAADATDPLSRAKHLQPSQCH